MKSSPWGDHHFSVFFIARSQRVRPLAGPMINSATKQSSPPCRRLDCFASLAMTTTFNSRFACELTHEEFADQRWLDIGHDRRAADRFEQNEGKLAALDLLVLRHQPHQRVRADFFLGETGDVLQMGRQANRGKMLP